jgi:hypothetical protein
MRDSGAIAPTRNKMDLRPHDRHRQSDQARNGQPRRQHEAAGLPRSPCPRLTPLSRAHRPRAGRNAWPNPTDAARARNPLFSSLNRFHVGDRQNHSAFVGETQRSSSVRPHGLIKIAISSPGSSANGQRVLTIRGAATDDWGAGGAVGGSTPSVKQNFSNINKIAFLDAVSGSSSRPFTALARRGAIG